MPRSLARLFQPVDIASLVFFRVAFGALMLWEVGRFLAYDWVASYYIRPAFHFTYLGFDWVRPWPGDGMYLHFYALGALAICIMLGLFYRAAVALFFFGFTYVFLLDQTHYQNHLYLVCLFSFLLILVPAQRAFSVDAVMRTMGTSEGRAGLWKRFRGAQVGPTWGLWALRAQMGLVYLHGGLAKLNGDWLRGEPMRMWLANRTDYPVVGGLFTQEWVVSLMSYGGLLLDLLAAPLLLWPRTRTLMMLVLVEFHLMNAGLFDIGIFPWLAIAATSLFLTPDWPRHLLGAATPREIGASGSESFRGVAKLRPSEGALVAVLAGFFVVQTLLPFRHYLYPGEVSWTEEGHRFSWHMKLRDKTGTVQLHATDPASGKTWEVEPLQYLSADQVAIMSIHPDMIQQFAQFLATELGVGEQGPIEVRAVAMVSLNGRPAQHLVNPEVDLAREPRDWRPSNWIRPLKE